MKYYSEGEESLHPFTVFCGRNLSLTWRYPSLPNAQPATDLPMRTRSSQKRSHTCSGYPKEAARYSFGFLKDYFLSFKQTLTHRQYLSAGPHYDFHEKIFLWLTVYLSARCGKFDGDQPNTQTLTFSAQVEEVRSGFQEAFDRYALST